jgi:hypothetical protein
MKADGSIHATKQEIDAFKGQCSNLPMQVRSAVHTLVGNIRQGGLNKILQLSSLLRLEKTANDWTVQQVPRLLESTGGELTSSQIKQIRFALDGATKSVNDQVFTIIHEQYVQVMENIR